MVGRRDPRRLFAERPFKGRLLRHPETAARPTSIRRSDVRLVNANRTLCAFLPEDKNMNDVSLHGGAMMTFC
jgi:hypothetical protein